MTELKLTIHVPELEALVEAVKALGTPYGVVETKAVEAKTPVKEETHTPVVTKQTESTPTTKTYTFEEIAKAGAELAQTNPAALSQLAEIFKTYNVPSLVQLDKKYYPEVVEKLRGMGAEI